jgi:hypothetical protein
MKIKYVGNLIMMMLFPSCIVFTACNDDISDQQISLRESSLNLVAPSGEKIADDIVSLRSEVSQVVAETFGVEKKFEITALNYVPLKKGFAVTIEYETADGFAKNYLKRSSKVSIEFAGALVIVFNSSSPRLKNGPESSDAGGRGRVECSGHGNCNDCRIVETRDDVTGNVIIRCSKECCWLTTYTY